jgi:hypothetical protein
MLDKLIGARGHAIHVRTVLFSVYDLIVRPYPWRLAWATCFGLCARMMNLLTFFAAIKGIFVAMQPEPYAAKAQQILNSFGIAAQVSHDEMVLAVVAGLLLVNIAAIAASYARSAAVRSLQMRFLADAEGRGQNVTPAQGRFLIDRAVPAIDTVVRISEIGLFCFVVCAVIAWINATMLLILLPLFVFIPLTILATSRRRLRLIADRQKTGGEYRQISHKVAGSPAVAATAKAARQNYISASFAMQKFQLRSQQASALMMTLGLAAIILYVAIGWDTQAGNGQAGLSLPIIFIVLALRQMTVYASELGQQFSLLLELRSEIGMLEDCVRLVNAGRR